MFPWPSNDVEHIIHSVNHIDISVPGCGKHRCITLRLSMPCMTRFIILSIIGFHFSDDISFVVDHEKFSEKVLAYAHRITIEE